MLAEALGGRVRESRQAVEGEGALALAEDLGRGIIDPSEKTKADGILTRQELLLRHVSPHQRLPPACFAARMKFDQLHR